MAKDASPSIHDDALSRSMSHDKPARQSFRPEVQGIRAVAALGVILAHLWPQWAMSGALGTFYFIVGAFFLESLARQLVERPQDVMRVRETLARNLFRILPEAYVAILLVCGYVLVDAPPVTRREDLEDGFYASIFMSNWWYHMQSTDYFARNANMSPFLPFWSLSLIVQAYVCGTLVYAALSRLSARFGSRFGDVVSISLHTCIFVVSLSHYLMRLLQDSLHSVHFLPSTWLWTFSLGALTARFIRKNRISPLLSRLLAITAVLVIPLAFIAHVFIMPTQFYLLGKPSPFFRFSILISAVLIMVAGASNQPSSWLRAFAWPQLVRIGNMSYIIFLIQWPVMVAYRSYTNRYDLTVIEGFFVTVAILTLAHLLHLLQQYIEHAPWSAGAAAVPQAGGDAVQTTAPRKSKQRDFPVWLMVTIPLGILALQTVVTEREPQVVETTTAAGSAWTGPGKFPGALARMGAVLKGLPKTEDFMPKTAHAKRDQSVADKQCFGPPDDSTPSIICLFGAVGAPRKVALFGASHMSQWHAAVNILALKYGWEGWYMSRSGCDYYPRQRTPDCEQWLGAATRQLLAQPADYLFVQASFIPLGGPEYPFGEERAAFLRKLHAVSTRIIGVRDTPRGPHGIPACISKYGRDSENCKMPVSFFSNETFDIISSDPDFTFLDTHRIFCSADSCEPIIGNVLVYRDNNHITATYMRSATPLLELAMLDKLPELMTVSNLRNATVIGESTFVTLKPTTTKHKAKPAKPTNPAPATTGKALR